MSEPSTLPNATSSWDDLADQVLAPQPITREQGLAVVRSSDDELLALLQAAFKVRSHYHGSSILSVGSSVGEPP